MWLSLILAWLLFKLDDAAFGADFLNSVTAPSSGSFRLC